MQQKIWSESDCAVVGMRWISSFRLAKRLKKDAKLNLDFITSLDAPTPTDDLKMKLLNDVDVDSDSETELYTRNHR